MTLLYMSNVLYTSLVCPWQGSMVNNSSERLDLVRNLLKPALIRGFVDCRVLLWGDWTCLDTHARLDTHTHTHLDTHITYVLPRTCLLTQNLWYTPCCSHVLWHILSFKSLVIHMHSDTCLVIHIYCDTRIVTKNILSHTSSLSPESLGKEHFWFIVRLFYFCICVVETVDAHLTSDIVWSVS